MTARITFSADHLRLDRHLLPRLPSFYTASELLDLPRYFVSLSDRIAGKRMLAMVDMDVRSAHADLSDLNQYLILFRLRNRHLPKLNFPRSSHYLLQHHTCTLFLHFGLCNNINTFIYLFIKVFILLHKPGKMSILYVTLNLLFVYKHNPAHRTESSPDLLLLLRGYGYS